MKNNQIKMSPASRVSLLKDERGMSTVEYVILLAVIVVGAVTVWNDLGGHVKDGLGEAEGDLRQLGE